jgi:exopolysaccharide biosynthesis predicted pyruvyltransferase EpsI
MRLINLSEFEPIFEPLSGLTVGMVDGVGNMGDQLLYLAARQLCKEFNIEHFTVNALAENPIPKCDKLLLFGGGNIGFPPAAAIRRKAFESGIPCWLLPQSVIRHEDLKCEKMFFRESVSRNIIGDGEIAPDLALGFDFPESRTHKNGSETFLRRNGGSVHHHVRVQLKVDPAMFCHTPEDYWNITDEFEEITTDRLHLAICSLAMKTKTTLLPINYHKNKAMFREWLEPLGCLWKDVVFAESISANLNERFLK